MIFLTLNALNTKYLIIMKASFLSFFFVFLIALSVSAGKKYYQAEGNAIVSYNSDRYNNRPLFCNNTAMFVLAGDKPLVKSADTPYLFGTWFTGFERNGVSKWFIDFESIRSAYTAGKMTWTMSDKAFPGVEVTLVVVPTDGSLGMTASLTVDGAGSSDRVIWAYGGAAEEEGVMNWKYDALGFPESIKQVFDPNTCNGNEYITSGNSFMLRLNGRELLNGTCSDRSEYTVGNAENWKDPNDLSKQATGEKQLLFASCPIPTSKSIYFVFHVKKESETTSVNKSPETCFKEGIKRTDALENRIRINTPDKELNALVTTSVASIDAIWYPPVFSHGAMLWNKPYLGWRCVFGATAYGWHDRVKESTAYYTAFQVKESDKTEPQADPERLYVDQSMSSRFYGKGYIDKYQYFYNMQSQFFDQIITEWRYTGDKELAEILYPALELHLEWVYDCFDPDGDGLFESYRNSWPTDSHWYGGGGTAEETAYVYKVHLAVADMCRLKGNKERAEYHQKEADRIRDAFNNKLWIKETGHSAKVIDQIGLQRKHSDPWLYSIFLPADVGLIDKGRISESVYYSEWAQQNVPIEEGGRQVYTSNFVPSIWSVRELWSGDNFHLALAYYKANLEKDAWDLFQGAFRPWAYSSTVPGNLGNPVGGMDFSDCTNPFARTLVEGLFGYNPDYPNGQVVFEPGFPQEWENVSATFPDFSTEYKKRNSVIEYTVGLKNKAAVVIKLPINVKKIQSVTMNGKKISPTIESAFGKNLLVAKVPFGDKAKLVVKFTEEQPYDTPLIVETNVGELLTVNLPNTEIISVSDPQEVLGNVKLSGGKMTAKAYSERNHHTVILTVRKNGFEQKRLLRLKVNNPERDKLNKSRFVESVPQNAKWKHISVDEYMNADVRTVYKQEYLSPRPNTVSLRIGSDGYSAWTFPYWDSKAPTITLDSVKLLQKGDHVLETPQRVPFRWNSDEKNIVFTSIWDNFPGRVSIPVHQKGEAVWFLVCGTTNPMQCQIANAVLRLKYIDGTEDKLELIPPVNYWNLSHIYADATEPGQDSRTYYFAKVDRFCLPEKLPETVVLGKDCRAMVLNHRLPEGKILDRVELETLSNEVVVGLMGMSIMNPVD